MRIEAFMTRYEKLLARLMDGEADSNFEFSDLCWLLARIGFRERIRGDHHIFTLDGLPEIINFQPLGKNAKFYQVRQVRVTILRYHLHEEKK